MKRIVIIVYPLTEVRRSEYFTKSPCRKFVDNLYKQVKDPNLVGSLSEHKESCKAFARYSEIDEEMKKELVDLLLQCDVKISIKIPLIL